MIKIRFYWQDLNEQMQQRLLNLFGDNGNWDCIPFCVMDVDSKKDYTLDSLIGDHEGYGIMENGFD